METLKQSARSGRFCPLRMAVWLSLSASARVGAQDVFIPSPVGPIQSEAYNSAITGDRLTPGPGIWDWFTGAETYLKNIRFGPVEAHPYFQNQFVYGNGVAGGIGTAGAGNTYLDTFTPGVAFNYKKAWTLNYSPQFRFFGDDRFEDVVNHSVGLTGAAVVKDWTLSFRHGAGISQQILAETQAATDQTQFDTTVRASRSLNSKLSWDTSINHSYRDATFSSAQNIFNYQGINSGLTYAYRPRIYLSADAGFGYVQTSDSRLDTGGSGNLDLISESISGRITLIPSDKVRLNFGGGLDFRQILRRAGSDRMNPTMNISVSYHPFEQTFMEAFASRSVGQSFFAGAQTLSTALGVQLRQRFLGRIQAQAEVNWTKQEFQLNLQGIPIPLNNFDQVNARLRLGTTILKRFNVGVGYQYSNFDYAVLFGNFSQKFNIHQVSFDIGIRF